GRPTVNGGLHAGSPVDGSATCAGATGDSGAVAGGSGAAAGGSGAAGGGTAAGTDGAAGGLPMTGSTRVAASVAEGGSATENQSSTSSRRGPGWMERGGITGSGAAGTAAAVGGAT